MSLTKFLSHPEVKVKFNEEFNKPKLAKNSFMRVRPRTTNYQLIGTSFDYLLRFYIKRINPQAYTSTWIAEKALADLQRDQRVYDIANTLILEAKENYNLFLQTGIFTDKLIKSVLLISQLDPIYRCCRYFPVKEPNPQDVEDLVNLTALLNPEIFKTDGVVCLNPTFDMMSDFIGGADADVVLDDLLLEIKTTQELSLQKDDFNQLIGYYTLSQLGWIDGAPPNHQINRLGIYYSRYGQLVTFNVKDIVDENRFPEFKEWFRENMWRGFN